MNVYDIFGSGRKPAVTESKIEVVHEYVNEDFSGLMFGANNEDIAGPGGSDNNDSTSPIHGFGEDYDNIPDLENVGEQVVSIMDAERRLAQGDRIFAFHEMDEEPSEIHDVGQLAGYDAEQLLAVPQGVAEGSNVDSQIKRIKDRILQLKDWNTTGSHDKKIKELQTRLKELPSQKQGVAEGSASHSALAKMAHDAYVAATRKGNGPMAAHYLKQHLKHKANAAKEKRVAEGRVLHRDLKSWTDDAKSQGLNVIKPKNDLEWTHHATDKTGKVCGKFCTTNVPQNSRGFIHKQGLAEMDGDGTRDREVAGPDSQVTGKDFTKTAQDLLNKSYGNTTAELARRAIVQKKVHEARGDYKPPKEADYGDDYQDMVKRVAAQEKRKQQRSQPQKKVSEDEQITSPASRELVRVARQSNPEATSDADAINAYMSSIAKKTQTNYKQVNDILRQLDPLNNELQDTERELNDVENVNKQQQDLLRRLSQRVDQVRTNTLPSQVRAANAPAQQQQARDERERADIAKKANEPKQQAPVQQPVQQPAQQPVPQGDIADTKARSDIETVSKHIKDLEQKIYAKDTTDKAKAGIIRDLNKAQSTLGAADPNKIRDLARSLHIDQTPQQELPFDESEVYESRLFAMKRAGYDIL